MKRTFAFLFAALLSLAVLAEQSTVIALGPQVVSVPKNTFTTAARAIPARVTALTLTLSRENWPASGIDIELLVSYDGGTVYESPGPSHIGPFIPTVKEPNVLDSPASIGVGWNQDVRQATHIKARTINASGAAFQSTLEVDALLAD